MRDNCPHKDLQHSFDSHSHCHCNSNDLLVQDKMEPVASGVLVVLGVVEAHLDSKREAAMVTVAKPMVDVEVVTVENRIRGRNNKTRLHCCIPYFPRRLNFRRRVRRAEPNTQIRMLIHVAQICHVWSGEHIR